MSKLLERAIIDANALRDAALKNAEQLVIEKYSLEVKEAMNQLLENEDITEQEEPGAMEDLFGADTGEEPNAAQPGEEDVDQELGIAFDDIQAEMPDAFRTDDDEIIQIKLDSLDDELEDEEGVFGGDDELGDDEISIDIEDDEPTADIDMDTTPDLDAPGADVGVDIAGIDATALEEIIGDALQDILSEEEETEEGESAEEAEETESTPQAPAGADDWIKNADGAPTSNDDDSFESDLDEEIDLEALMEKVRVDFDPQKSGWAGTPESIMQEYESMLLAREQDSEVKEENEELRKNVAALQKENKTLSSAALKLQEQNKKFNTTFKTLQEKLETMNVSNAKLLYINQALENASLNERQKRKIVEAISKAETVQEAKIVFETMNDTVATTSDVKKDRTLSEMVSRKSSLLVAARKEQPKQDANPMYNRLQKLAGIKTK